VQAAIAQKSHYLDLTGEQSFIKLVYDKYHEQAQAAGICLVPACAFEYAIGDALGALLFSELPGCNQLDFVYHVDGMYTSAGTRKSIIRACAADGFQYRNNKVEKTALGSSVKTAKIDGKQMSAMTFPAGESLMLPRHINVQNINTFMSAQAPAFLLPLFAGLAQSVMKVGGDLLVNSMSETSPSLQQRRNTKFHITAN